MLLDKATDFAKEKGVTRLELDSWSFNENALSLFKKYGFKTFNEKLFMTRKE